MKIQFLNPKTRLLLTALIWVCALFPLGAAAQGSFNVSGEVVDKTSGEPLIGVTVIEKSNPTKGTSTDFDGKFNLTVSSGDVVLSFSYVGYASLELKAKDANGTVQMEESSTLLNEVVVVGYGTQKKVNLSGAVSSINGDEISSRPASDALSALQGQVPGLQVLRSSGQPGSETSGMRIRGFSSANATSTLVLVDGVESDMTLLNPNDIESVSVLKDAAACAIYGARAAAGVVLVTTKRGSEGKPKVSYNGYVGMNKPGLMPERVTAWQEQVMINEARLQAGGGTDGSLEFASWIGNPNFSWRPNNTNGRWEFFESTNWVAEGTRKYTFQQSHNVSVTGGNKSTNYLVSGGYFSKNGILKYGPDKNERYNVRINLNTELNEHINLEVLASYDGKFLKQNPYGAAGLLSRLYRVRGRQPIYNPEEDPNPYNGDLQVNAIDIMKNGGLKDTQYQSYTGKGTLNIKDYFVKGLGLRLSASRRADYYSEQTSKRTLEWKDRLGISNRNTANSPNSYYRQKNNAYHDNLEALLTYNGKFGKNQIDVLAGTSYERYRKDQFDATVKNLNSNDFFSFNAYDNEQATNTSVADNIETWAMNSYFGRLNYNFDERYLFEANIRYDGSSRLAPGRRWHAFPSFSAAWRISQEEWFRVEPINSFKLRASWGQLGNGAILGLYDYIATISRGINMGEASYYQSAMASVDKTWEIISSTNIGLDMGFLNNTITLTADYYWKKNDNMLANVTLPHIVGITVPKSNVGTLKSWGWEVEVGYRNRFGDVDFNASVSLSDADNKVVSYKGQNTIAEGSVDILEGYPLNSIWGYKTDGMWQSRQEYLDYKAAHPGYESFNDAKVSGGDIKYVAQGDGAHTIGQGGGTPENPGDLVYLGSSNGRYFYTFSLGASWKGFDFNIMFQGVGKRKVYVEPDQLAPLKNTYDMPWTIHTDYWTEDNPNASLPRLYNGNNFNYKASDRWVQDGSYLRLKNVTFGYTIPVPRKTLERLRVYISGDDVWEHTNMLKVFDPEVGNKPSANYYPFFRTWTFGVNLTL
ncbi:MAG: TonB-dependent receptor [Bacteroides sp.]|nr:TonB-dependent receptor [Bacteroides sp.]MBD5300948.1 TonB-dependent receptor [Bacteroides sp.]MDE5827327.1 TonB-dependent receptor [Duncaniella sp.]MDE6824930.1 TonB-dependent receptor [Duncaniella sp.]